MLYRFQEALILYLRLLGFEICINVATFNHHNSFKDDYMYMLCVHAALHSQTRHEKRNVSSAQISEPGD